MKVFIQSQNGEDGPFSPPELRQLFEQGKLPAEPLCRVDGATQTTPLLERFPEFASPEEDPEDEARQQRWIQRRRKRARIMIGGALLFAVGLVLLFTARPVRGVIMVIGGFVIFVHGCIQTTEARKSERRGINRWDDSRRVESKRTTPRTYDY